MVREKEAALPRSANIIMLNDAALFVHGNAAMKMTARRTREGAKKQPAQSTARCFSTLLEGWAYSLRTRFCGVVGGRGLYFFGAATPFRRWAWCTPGARFLASGREAAEKTGGVNVKTSAIFFENCRAAPDAATMVYYTKSRSSPPIR
ncbi:hypothetical protein ES703_53529 [subsurface metagenome]